MRLGQVLITAFLGIPSLAAHADTFATFSFTGSAVTYGLAGDFNTVSGMTTIDTTNGMVQSLVLTEAGFSQLGTQSGVRSQLGAEVFVAPSLSAFSFSEASLIGYTGSTFNLRTPFDLYVGSTNLTGTSSTSTPTAVTPELSTLGLSGTGLVALMGWLRKRSGRSIRSAVEG